MRGMTEDLADAASAYLAWWDMAGVDGATTETPVNWLRPTPAATRPSSTSSPATVKKPVSLQDFTTWLAEDAGQPERRWQERPYCRRVRLDLR